MGIMDYVLITTYQRPKQVESLVASIQEVFTGKIIVFNDGGEVPELSGCELINYKQNHGKTRYWQLVTDIFQHFIPKRNNKLERFWLLPDDVKISPNLFTESVRLWESIKDERKISLSVGHTHNRHYLPCWTEYQPVKMGEVVLTGWNDLCFMAERLFLEQLNYEIERPLSGYDFRSSGVGRHISRTLFNQKFNMYHTDKSLCEFLVLESQMHRQNQKQAA